MNQRDFHQTTPSQNSSDFFSTPDYSYSSQPFQEINPYTTSQYPSDFLTPDSYDPTAYHPYSNQYMSMNYGYMPYEYNYNYGNFYKERKPYKPYKRRYNTGYTMTQKIYTKKPKQPQQIDGDGQHNGMGNHIAKEGGAHDIEKLPHNIEMAKFFVIKSYSEEDVHKAIKHNVWCSTKEGNLRLHDAYVTANGEYPIFLLYSVNSSGYFVGVAQMKSHVDFEKSFEGWNHSHKWKGVFKISWVYIKDIPNKELRHLTNELNEGKPVTHSRDCQEVPFEVGVKVLEVFENYKNETSILDDFEYYEVQEKNSMA